MTDQIQLELVISAQVDRVLAGMTSFEKSLNTVGKAHQEAAAQGKQHTQILENFGSTLDKLRGYANVFAAFEAIKGAMSALDGLEQHNIELLRTTEILGGNATAASTWSVVAHEMGVSLDQIDKAFTKLSANLNATGSPALKQMGISAEDARGKLRPLDDVINQAADYFRAHAGAANNAALANALFGKSGFELLPILEQGTAGLNKLTEEARKYGLILDAETIQRNAAFTFQLKESQLALDGLGLAASNAALPGLAALGQGVSKLIEDNLPAFVAMINRAVSYVVGFIEGITGMTLQVGQGALALSDLNTITGDTGSSMDKAAGASTALAEAIQRVRDQTKAATDAIDDQVASLQKQQALETFMDRQAKLQQDLANKAHDIDKLRQKQYEEYWLGNFQTSVDIGDQINRALQDKANITEQINSNTLDQQTKDQVSALEAQKQSIQDAANHQIAAMQKAAKGTTDALGAAASAIPGMYSKMGGLAGQGFANDFNAEGIGTALGKQLSDAFLGPVTTVITSGKGGNVEKEVRGAPQWQAIGAALGQAIATGIATTVGAGVSNWVLGIAHDMGRRLNNVANQLAAAPLGGAIFSTEIAALRINANALEHFHTGGVVGGPEGQERVVKVLSGEAVLTREQQGAVGRALDTVGMALEPFIGPTQQYVAAQGAIFTRPTYVLAAEAGVPEALVPLGPSGSMPASIASSIAASAAPGASPLPAALADVVRSAVPSALLAGSPGGVTSGAPGALSLSSAGISGGAQAALAPAFGPSSSALATAGAGILGLPTLQSSPGAFAAARGFSAPQVAPQLRADAVTQASAPAAAPESSAATDMSETNRLLRHLIELVGARPSSSVGTGAAAALAELAERASGNRRRLGPGGFSQ